jgi:CBS domain-containing protein
MFHLFTLQGKRIDAQLEQLPKNTRVHHTKSNNRLKKFMEGDPRNNSGSEPGVTGSSYGADVYKEAMQKETIKSPVFHASDIMSSPVFTIGSDISVNDAWKNFMEKKVHHMPVLSPEGKLVGIVSDRDLLKKLIISDGKIEAARDAVVNDIMSTEVIATTPLTDIRRIAKGMLDHHIGAMPIVNDDGVIVGIITRSDILYAIIHQPELKLWA